MKQQPDNVYDSLVQDLWDKVIEPEGAELIAFYTSLVTGGSVYLCTILC